MRGKYLSATIKRKRIPLLILRDYPNGKLETCCYCNTKFDKRIAKRRMNWEHLDDNKSNQQLWNLAWSCFECNQRKKNDYDLKMIGMEIIAKNKLWEESQNPESIPVCETNGHRDTTEIELSPIFFEIAHDFLKEKIPDLNKRITIKLAANTIAARCIKRIGQGSPITARRNLDILSTEEFIYRIEKIEGQYYILIDEQKQKTENIMNTHNNIKKFMDDTTKQKTMTNE